MTAAGDLWEQAPVVSPGAAGAGLRWRALAGYVRRAQWCWPALLTLALGSYRIGGPELWRDELASWTIAERPLGGMFATGHRIDGTLLAYYLVLHGWIEVFGDSAVAMRSLSVLAMAGAAVCVTLIGRRLAGPRAGQVAGLVFALVPSISRFAQEVRSYALQVLLATLATLLLLRAMDKPLVRRWAAYAAAVAILGYIDLVALVLVTGHLAAVTLTWRKNREDRLLWFVPAVAAAIAACLPLIIVGSGQAASQISWILRPGLDLNAFGSFARNLCFSTPVAVALLVLAVVAWVVRWRAAAFATAVMLLPVAALWAVSQGTYSYFFPRYVLFAVAAWAILTGIAVSRSNAAVAVAVVLLIALLGAGDQWVIREPGAHNWAGYPVSADRSNWNYEDAASVIADGGGEADAGIVFPADVVYAYLMVDEGVRYYLEQDGAPVPRQIFIAKTAEQANELYAVPCRHPAACVGNETRIWILTVGREINVWTAVPSSEAAALRPRYHLIQTRHTDGLSIFLLQRDAPGGSAQPSIYQLRGDKSDKSGAEMVRTDRKMRKVVRTDRKMASGAGIGPSGPAPARRSEKQESRPR